MKRTALLFVLLALGTGVRSAHANNDLNTSFRSGSIALPSPDDSSSSDASTVGVNQGRVSYRVPIVTPPGHPNLPLELGLSYTGSRAEDVVGVGWTLGIPQIRVRTEGRGGQPVYGVGVTYLGFSGEELVEIAELDDADSDGLPEIEFREERDRSFIRYALLSAGGFRAELPNGQKLTLGTSPTTRVERIGVPGSVLAWLPDVLEDPLGNEIRYRWSAGTGSSRYLDEIRYACSSCDTAVSYQSVVFTYDDRAVLGAETTLDFSAGFLVELDAILTTIATRTVVSGAVQAVRTHALDYEVVAGRARLIRVTTSAGAVSLPPVELSYTNDVRPVTPTALEPSERPALAFQRRIQPLDFDLDGRVDVVDFDLLAPIVYPNIGQGRAAFGPGEAIAGPPGVAPTTDDVSLEDSTRDLAIDVVDLDTGLSTGTVYEHNRATGWAAGRSVTVPSIARGDNTLRIDANGDGRTDFVDTNPNPWRIWFDDGAGNYTEFVDCTGATPTFGPSRLTASQSGVVFGDVNGDGLVDVVRLSSGTTAQVWYGRGRACFGFLPEDGRADTFETFTITQTVKPPDPASSRMADVTGDGRADIVVIDDPGNEVRVFEFTPGVGFADIGGFVQIMDTLRECRLADFDADGVGEILCSSGWNLYDFGDALPHLLAGVDNGRGLATSIEYTTSARVAASHALRTPWTTNVAAVMPAVSRVVTNDGRASIREQTYDYRDAYYAIDAVRDRFEFVGYGYVAERTTSLLADGTGATGTDPSDPGVLVRSFFDVGATDWYLRGTLVCREEWPGSAAPVRFDCGAERGALVRTEQTWATDADEDGFVRVELDTDERHVLEGRNSGVVIRTEHAFDDFGNETQTVRHGVYRAANPELGNDENVVETEYVTDESSWNLRLPRRVVRGDLDPSAADPTVLRLEETCYVYDGAPDCEAPTVTAGLRTETRVWHSNPITGVDVTETIETVEYTSRGLPEVATDALGFEARRTYDPVFGIFATGETVDPTGLALSTSQLIDPRHGGVLESVAPDGSITRASYDLLGRMTSVAKPGDTLASPTLARTYVDGAPLSTLTDVAKDGTPDGLTTVTSIDGRGKIVCQTRETGGGFVDVISQNDWTARGFSALSVLPYRAHGCDPMSVTVSGGVATRSIARAHDLGVVDALGRPLVLTHSANGTSQSSVYTPLVVTSLDEEDNDGSSIHTNTPTVTVTDGLGRTVRVDETHLANDADAGTHSYEYGYTALGDLALVTDSMGNVVFDATYDSRRRRVQVVEADRGTMTTTFDARGSLDTVTDARGEVLDYAWDGAGRVTSVAASDGTVSYRYDDHPIAARTIPCHTTGRLAEVVDRAGSTVYCYDARGRNTREKRTFTGVPGVSTTDRTYDSMDRMTSILHPDDVRLSYAFSRDGRLDTVTARSGAFSYPVVTDVIYEPSGAPASISLGNGATVSRGYDSRQRLETLGLSTLGVDEQDLTLELDGVGNVASITDGVGMSSASFEYDDLYRLTSASGDRFGGHTATYRYDRIGNMRLKTFSDPGSPLDIGVLAYGDPIRVHAVTDAAGETFGYDGAGNLDSDADHVYGWTPYAMLGAVSDALTGATLVEYTYDHHGRRVVTDHLVTGDDVYRFPDSGAELRVDATTATLHKYVSVGSIVVAKIDGRFTAANVNAHAVYYANDYLGSPAIVMDTTGAIVERWDYHPYGEENRLSLDAAGVGGDYRDPSDPSTSLTRRFQGRDIDSATGHYDFDARVYRADLGRFMSPDSVIPGAFNSQAWNRYAFVFNNPLRYVDPSGHDPEVAVAEPTAAPALTPDQSALLGPIYEPSTQMDLVPVEPFIADPSLTYTSPGGVLTASVSSDGFSTEVDPDALTRAGDVGVTEEGRAFAQHEADSLGTLRGEAVLRNDTLMSGLAGGSAALGTFKTISAVGNGLTIVGPFAADAVASVSAGTLGAGLTTVGGTVSAAALPVSVTAGVCVAITYDVVTTAVPREPGMPMTGYQPAIENTQGPCNGGCHY